MSWFHWTCALFFLGLTYGNPAVRVRVTQNGLDYAINSAMDYARKQLENYPLPDARKTTLFGTFAFTNMTMYNINITTKSLRSVSNKGIDVVLRDIDADVKGKLRMSWLSGTVGVGVESMSVAMHMHLGVKGGRLVVSNVTCVSSVKNIRSTSMLLSLFSGVVKSEFEKIACEKGGKAVKKNLNEQFAKFPVKKNLKKSVTLDYSVVKAPEYTLKAVDLFLKGEFQPSNWSHQPAALPTDDSRDRMLYVTIMDHMINSASHAYYNQDAMRVQVSVKQTPQLLPKGVVKKIGSYLTRVNTGLNLIKQSACANCNLDIALSATSPPQIRTSHSGMHLTIQALAKINVILRNNKKHALDIAANVTATAIPKLNGTNLNTSIRNLKINTKVVKTTVFGSVSGSVEDIKKIVKEQIEQLLKNGISAMEIPLPLSKKFQLVKPKISYGQGYMTLETDVSIAQESD